MRCKITLLTPSYNIFYEKFELVIFLLLKPQSIEKQNIGKNKLFLI